MTMLKLDLITIALIFLAEAWLNTGEANEGFYLMAGAGHNNSAWNDEFAWVDNGELGTDFGFGYRHNTWENITIDVSFKHKSQLMSGAPFNNDNESGVESYFIDVYWFPFN